MKIKNKVYYNKKENRMKDEGNVLNARALFYSAKTKNLKFLLKNRYDWMNFYINPENIGIEIGAGTGISKEFIKCKNFKISDYAEYDFLDYKNIDATNTNFDSEKFDFVIASNVIHHISHPKKCFIEVDRILKKGGKFIIQDINCSIVTQIITMLMKHEGFDFGVDVFDENVCATNSENLWSGNDAIPNLLFDDMKKFKNEFPNFQLLFHDYKECICFLNSGGVIAKTFYIPLNYFLLQICNKFDIFLTKFFPKIFALQRQIVLKKIN